MNREKPEKCRSTVQKNLPDLMLKNGFLEPEEYAQIDALNRSTFSPELAEVYA